MTDSGLTQDDYKRCGKNGRYDAELDRYFLDELLLLDATLSQPVDVVAELPTENTSKGKKL